MIQLFMQSLRPHQIILRSSIKPERKKGQHTKDFCLISHFLHDANILILFKFIQFVQAKKSQQAAIERIKKVC